MKRLIVLVIICAPILSKAQSVTVMTYNIRYDNVQDGINEWKKRKQKVYDVIRKYSPDLLGVQEALHNQLTDITTNLKEYGFVGVGRDDGKQKGEYSALLFKKAKYKIINQNTFWLSEKPTIPGSKSWDAAITRVATWAKILDRKMKREFVVINTHFDHIGKVARAKSAAMLKAKAVEIGKNLPVIITGDFNTTRDDLPYQEMMSNRGLNVVDTAPANPPGTFCSFAVNSIPCRPIDYIFHTLEWKADSYLVITDNDGANYPSDHLPVMVRLEIK
jgi:endonuclease/exonuclease/phosphatase family metal-dependent hydrolase